MKLARKNSLFATCLVMALRIALRRAGGVARQAPLVSRPSHRSAPGWPPPPLPLPTVHIAASCTCCPLSLANPHLLPPPPPAPPPAPQAAAFLHGTAPQQAEDKDSGTAEKKTHWYNPGFLRRPIETALEKSGVVTDPDLRYLLASGGSFALLGVGGVSVLGTLGVDTAPLVAAVGVSGLTIGYSARDLLSNFIAGLLIVATKPFRRGDTIYVGKTSDGMGGRVEKIDLRTTYIRMADGALLQQPNSSLLNSSLVIPAKSDAAAGTAAPRQ